MARGSVSKGLSDTVQSMGIQLVSIDYIAIP